MPLELLKCPSCGASLPAEVVGAVVTCGYCGRAVRDARVTLPPPELGQTVISRPPGPMTGARGARGREGGPGSRFRRRVAGGTSGPPRVRVAIERGKAPITLPPGKVGGVFRRRAFEKDVERLQSFGWTDDEIIDLANRMLGTHDDLYYAPNIPEEKLGVAHATHASMGPDERVLVLFDDTLFGGSDDGFSISARGIFWKNLADDPQSVGWDEIVPAQVSYEDEDHRIGGLGEDLHLTHADAEVLAPRLHDLIVCLASLAQDEDE